MKKEEIVFDNIGFCYDVIISQQKQELMIAKQLDDIDFCLEEQVDLTYHLINSANQWYAIAKNHILNETNDFSSYLTIIYLLEKNVFGLSFELNSEPEHGYGIKLNASTFEIIEYGSGEVAFS